MAQLIVYFDDSGTHPESNSAIAACYIASVKGWKRFTHDWKEVSDREGFRAFHISEFAARAGTFETWSEPKRKRVLGKLCQIINRHVDAGFVVGVCKADYDAVVPQSFRRYSGRYHYTFSVRQCATGVRGWRADNQATSNIQYVFDQMGKGKGEIMAVLDEAKQMEGSPLLGYAFEDKTQFLPLQAADILAWSYFQRVQHQLVGRPLCIEAHSVLHAVHAPVGHKLYNRDTLRKWYLEERAALSLHSRRTLSR